MVGGWGGGRLQPLMKSGVWWEMRGLGVLLGSTRTHSLLAAVSPGPIRPPLGASRPRPLHRLPALGPRSHPRRRSPASPALPPPPPPVPYGAQASVLVARLYGAALLAQLCFAGGPGAGHDPAHRLPGALCPLCPLCQLFTLLLWGRCGHALGVALRSRGCRAEGRLELPVSMPATLHAPVRREAAPPHPPPSNPPPHPLAPSCFALHCTVAGHAARAAAQGDAPRVLRRRVQPPCDEQPRALPARRQPGLHGHLGCGGGGDWHPEAVL